MASPDEVRLPAIPGRLSDGLADWGPQSRHGRLGGKRSIQWAIPKRSHQNRPGIGIPRISAGDLKRTITRFCISITHRNTTPVACSMDARYCSAVNVLQGIQRATAANRHAYHLLQGLRPCDRAETLQSVHAMFGSTSRGCEIGCKKSQQLPSEFGGRPNGCILNRRTLPRVVLILRQQGLRKILLPNLIDEVLTQKRNAGSRNQSASICRRSDSAGHR